MKKIRLPQPFAHAGEIELNHLSDEELRVLGNMLNETEGMNQQVLLYTAIALKCGLINKAQKAAIDNCGGSDFYSIYLQEKDRREVVSYFAAFSL